MKSNLSKHSYRIALGALLVFGVILSFSGCKKKTVTKDPITASFTQKCVVEKYTGEWCGNCPAAGSFFETAKTSYPTKFIGVAIHAGSPGSDQFMDHAANGTMYNYLYQQLKSPTGSTTIGFPNVMFMRSPNPSNGGIINGYNSSEWSGKLSSVLAQQPASAGLKIVSHVVGTTLSTTVSFQVSKALPAGSYAITAYLVENNLDGSKQVSAPSGYKQQHVLRELLTPQSGTTIDVTTLYKPFEVKLSDISIAGYKVADLEIVAFIHKNGSTYDDRQIVNGQIVKAGLTQNFD